MKKRWLAWSGYLIAGAALLLNGWTWQSNNDFPDIYNVRQVIDGDTMVIEDGLRIRLNSVNAPELDKCGGPEAKSELESLIKNEKVGIKIIGADNFQRPLVTVYQNGRNINRLLLESGWTDYASSGRASTDKEELRIVANQAKEEKLGIFSSKCTQLVNEAKPECSIKGNFNQTNERKVYHFPGCQQYGSIPVELHLGDQWFCSEAEAKKAGFVKSGQCLDKKFVKDNN